MHHIVSTEEFWKLMCKPAFHRIDRHTGRVDGDTYHVTTPPEDVKDFVKWRSYESLKDLSIPREEGPVFTIKHFLGINHLSKVEDAYDAWLKEYRKTLKQITMPTDDELRDDLTP